MVGSHSCCCEWLGDSRTRATIQYWCQSYADHHDQDFTTAPERIAVDEKQVQLGEERIEWPYAAIDADSKVVAEALLRRSWTS